MSGYIKLNRRFKELTNEELVDYDNQLFNNSLSFSRYHSSSLSWDNILEYQRVILLSDAGSGKTDELKHTASKLTKKGELAFFTPLESLQNKSFKSILNNEEKASFKEWKSNSKSRAWFFLDSVDELKLSGGKLKLALRELARTLNGNIERAHIILSCRPNDWQQVTDRSTFLDLLPIPEVVEEEVIKGKEYFLQFLDEQNENNTAKTSFPKDFIAVTLLPLDQRQVKIWAKHRINNFKDFLKEVKKCHASIFTKRPMDLVGLGSLWNTRGKLGTLKEQIEADLEIKLTDNPDRSDSNLTSLDSLNSGSQRLALAATLTKHRHFHSPEVTVLPLDETDIDPEKILYDWRREQVRSLCRKPLFTPASYGQIRFHHRSIQEYLSAKYLSYLSREKGMNTPTLNSLLFAERYNEEVVIPSMKPIAAWLALWNENVRQEIIKRDPICLISFGDPESLSLQDRERILLSFIDKFGKGTRRGFYLINENVQRLSHIGLGPIIKEYWQAQDKSDDVVELLIDLIRFGEITDCSSILASVASDGNHRNSDRDSAIRGLIALKCNDEISSLIDAFASEPQNYSDKLITGLLPDLYPEYMSFEQLCVHAKRQPETSNYLGVTWAIKTISENLSGSHPDSLKLANFLSELILSNNSEDSFRYHLKSRYDHLSEALIILCGKILSKNRTAWKNDDFLLSCIVGTRYQNEQSFQKENLDRLKNVLPLKKKFYRAVFWKEFEFLENGFGADPVMAYEVYSSLIIQWFNSESKQSVVWLFKHLTDDCPNRQKLALLELCIYWNNNDRNSDFLDRIRSKITGNTVLEHELNDFLSKARDPSIPLEWEVENQVRKEAAEKQKIANREEWKMVRKKVMHPDAFQPDKSIETRNILLAWLRHQKRSSYKYTCWDKLALKKAFSKKIASKSRKLVAQCWRDTEYKSWSETEKELRNSTSNDYVIALNGLAAEAEKRNWQDSLNPSELELAIKISIEEHNGFASYLGDLIESHPTEVSDVFSIELNTQLEEINTQDYLPILFSLTKGSPPLKALMAPSLLSFLTAFVIPSDPNYKFITRSISFLTAIISEAKLDDTNRNLFVAALKQQYESVSNPSLKQIFLRKLYECDPEKAFIYTEILLSSFGGSDVEKAVDFLAGLFSQYDGLSFQLPTKAKQASALASLIRHSYRLIKQDDDQNHKGCFTPDLRDRAQTARGRFLNMLIDLEGPEAHQELVKLTNDSEFSDWKDRIIEFAKDRASADSEFKPYKIGQIKDQEERYIIRPNDRDSMFAVMVERLNELAYDLQHHDYNDRKTLRSITLEEDMQRTLAWRLHNAAKGAYSVVRENEVADRNRTDIQLISSCGNHRAVIELKLADSRWTIKELEKTLEDQIDAQYLRHDMCRAACLLITHHGDEKRPAYIVDKKKQKVLKDYKPRTEWKFKDGKRMISLSWEETLERLKEKAKELEAKSNNQIRLTVVGLDLRDPIIKSPHK
jgi:hypothetical protein